MSFAAPQMFWLLIIPLAMVAFFWWSWRVRQKLIEQFIQARLLTGLIAGVSVQRRKIRAGLLIGAMVFLIVALARLQWGYSEEEVPDRGLDIVVAIDTSKSMLATDIAPNRLARAKLAALDLAQVNYDRDLKQVKVQAVSQAAVDADKAALDQAKGHLVETEANLSNSELPIGRDDAIRAVQSAVMADKAALATAQAKVAEMAAGAAQDAADAAKDAAGAAEDAAGAAKDAMPAPKTY